MIKLVHTEDLDIEVQSFRIYISECNEKNCKYVKCKPNHGFYIFIERVSQDSGDDQWVIRESCYCMTKGGNWLYESLPSNRTKDFLKRTRYTSYTEAVDVIRKYLL